MLKKGLIILCIIFSIICISNTCLAANTANNVKNAVSSTTNTIVDGVSNLAHDVRNGVGHVENGVEDALTMDDTMANTDTRTTTATGDYQTARTADMTRAATGTDNTTMWVWLIVAVAAVVIISLVWYYGAQNRVD